MTYLIGAFFLLLAVQLAVLVGPPYVPTMRKQRKTALDLMDLRSGQTLYDLGCGDGSLLIDAAQRGIRAVGYEINPLLFALGWVRTRRYKSLVKVKLGNFWKADLSNADGVFVFLAGKYMKKLDKMISGQKTTKQLKVVSYAFEIPGQKPVKKQGALFLYHYF